MQWSGYNEISLRNNLEDAEVAVKKPRLRVRQGKTGYNGRDVMRFHRVIILPEAVSCLKAASRRDGFEDCGPPRGARRDGFGNCGPPCGARRNTFDRNELRHSLFFSSPSSPQVCFGNIRRGDEAEADTFPVLAHHLPV